MDRLAIRVFRRSVTTNWRAVIGAALLDASGLLLSAAFSALLALYFGFDVFNITRHPWAASLTADPVYIVMASLAVAVLLLVARVLATLLDAHVVFNRELWLARRIRAAGPSGTKLSPKTVPRASNHYGRLCLASMNASSALIILAANAVILPFLLSSVWAAAVLGLLIFCFALFALFFIDFSRRMQNAMSYMMQNAGIVARWKITPGTEEPAELALYSRAYTARIFLTSIFSYAPALLGIAFTLALLIGAEIGSSLNFGQIFVAFVLAQTYLGLVARLFNSMLKASAFAPSVAPHADVVLSDAPHFASGTAPEATPQERAAAARERDDEMLGLDE